MNIFIEKNIGRDIKNVSLNVSKVILTKLNRDKFGKNEMHEDLRISDYHL